MAQVLSILQNGVLTPPRWFLRDLGQAVTAGERAASAAPVDAPKQRSTTALKQWLPRHLPLPESGFDNDAELAVMHRVANTRTQDGNERAKYLANDGNDEIWKKHFEEWKQVVGPSQAKRGASLLAAAVKLTAEFGRDIKKSVGRKRPYLHDPTLELVVPKPPPASMSWPSGHTSRAYAAATVLAHLMPERKSVFMNDAAEMAYSRVYGGAHYPSDTVAGAWLGTLVGNWLIKSSTV